MNGLGSSTRSNGLGANNPGDSLSSAAQLIGDSLKHGDDLNKIGTLRKKIRSELSSVESQLRAGAKDQLDATRAGISRLMDTRVGVGEIREQMVNVDRLCGDPRTRVEGFDKIGEVSKIHRNFVYTLDMVNQLREMYDKLDYIESLLVADKQDPLGPAPNLLVIHYHLTQLETFRNETVLQAKRSGDTSAEALQTLQLYFERLDALLKEFEEHYINLAKSLIDLAREGQAAVAVKIAKIAEVEGARDEKAIAIKLVKKKGAELASKFKSLQADARVIKHYRARVMDAIRSSAREAIEACRNDFDTPMEFLDHLNWIYEDLVMVEDQFQECFPPDWKIYTVFIKAYHKALYDYLKEFVASEPDAASLLRLANYCKEYHKTMTKELDIPPEMLEPRLLDGKQHELIDDYLRLIVKKMDEWTGNIMKTQTEDFASRMNPPDEDADGMYNLADAVIMFQMVNQQVDLAADSGQGLILARVVEEAGRNMRETQATWSKLLDSEFKRQVERPPEEVAGGLAEYVMALANNQVKSADFAEALLARTEPLVSEKYREPIAQHLSDAMDAFIDVAKKCIQTLINIVFNDLKPATKMLFTPAWYNEEPMVQIIETIQDYMSDFQQHLQPNLYELLVEDLVDAFLIAYLAALRKASKFKLPGAAGRLREDVRKAFGYFATIKNNRAELQEDFEVLECMLKIITASKTMFFLDYWPFAKKYGPNMAYVEAVLRARDDLDRKQVNEMMESIKRKVSEEPMDEPQSDIFSRLPADKSLFSNILPL